MRVSVRSQWNMASRGFSAIVNGIRTAAHQAAAVGEDARELGYGAMGLGAVATTISQALRGTRSATAAAELSTAPPSCPQHGIPRSRRGAPTW
ncbi:MAG: hypothetical protein M3460_07965 [Actinomycetota bacterium]|nr:hypothetical protein [Actinomycetota bacterium]